MDLEQLVDQPSQAHRAWDRLTADLQRELIRRMRLRYGDRFVEEFRGYHATGGWQSSGYLGTHDEERALNEINLRFRQSFRSLEAAGFQPATNPTDHSWRWVHPQGFEIWIWPGRSSGATAGSRSAEPRVPTRVNPHDAHPEYGHSWNPRGYRTVVATSDGVGPLVLRGVVTAYDRGVIEVFAEGSRSPWTFYPADGSPYGERFLVYDPSGRRMDHPGGRPREYTVRRDQTVGGQ